MPRAKRSRVLFVGGGRRVSLAVEFTKRDARVYGYELDASCPLSEVATEIVEGGDFDDPDTLDDIVAVVKRLKITHVVPLMDEAAVLVGGLEATVGSPCDVAETCRDKRKFADWMMWHHAELYPSPSILRYPRIAKPRYGHSSRGLVMLHRPFSSIERNPNYVVQDYVDADEVSVDVWVMRDGSPGGAVARRRDRVEGGEAVVSTVLPQAEALLYVLDASAVCCDLGIRGPANVQFRGGKVIEVNARFGGGCVLSIAAGFDMVGLALGLKVGGPPWPVRHGLTMRRYFAESYRCE